jgi:hypothetical protein
MQVNDHTGLACSGWTWALAALLVVLWLVLPPLALRRRGGWRAMPQSFLGFFWLGFGVDFVVRFLLLTWDSVEFGNDTFRLADVPTRSLDRAMVLAIAYWAAAVLGFACWQRGRRAGPLAVLPAVGGSSPRRRLGILLGCTACMVATSADLGLPLMLLTPFSIVGRLWVVPATFVWAEWFASARPTRADARRRWLVLLPALLHFALSPFRENLAPLALVPLLALLCVRGYVPRRAVAAAVVAVILFLAAGSATQRYRDVRWGGEDLDEAALSAEQELPDPDWLVTVRRFHGFDSLLLTVDLVPSAYAHREQNVLLDGVLRGVVPRALLPEKRGSNRGVEFAQTIWAHDSGLESSAAIAPSMPGDLYYDGGAWLVVVGALVWGLVLGGVERWAGALPAGARATVLVLFSMQIVPSVERDFAHCLATFLQSLVVLFVVGVALRTLARARVPRWEAPRAHGARA